MTFRHCPPAVTALAKTYDGEHSLNGGAAPFEVSLFQRNRSLKSVTVTGALLINQGDVQVRHVHLNVPHSANPKPSWYGESVGRYEGDELVVDTIGFNDKTFVDDTYNVPHTAQLHVVERFKMIEGGKALEVNVTVEDPGAFNAPWSAIARYRRATSPQPVTEQPCAENNLDLGDNYDTPTAAKPDF